MSLQESKGHHERAITAEWARITACEDCCLQGLLKGEIVAVASVKVREDTDQACFAAPCVITHVKVCGKTMGPCVAVLCVDVDMVHQEFITGRVCNSHMVSIPTIWI